MVTGSYLRSILLVLFLSGLNAGCQIGTEVGNGLKPDSGNESESPQNQGSPEKDRYEDDDHAGSDSNEESKPAGNNGGSPNDQKGKTRSDEHLNGVKSMLLNGCASPLANAVGTYADQKRDLSFNVDSEEMKKSLSIDNQTFVFQTEADSDRIIFSDSSAQLDCSDYETSRSTTFRIMWKEGSELRWRLDPEGVTSTIWIEDDMIGVWEFGRTPDQ